MDPTENDTRLAKLAQATPSTSPAFTLVARMRTKVSRESVKASLRTLLRLANRPYATDRDLLDFPWHKLAYSDVATIRGLMLTRYAPATINRHLSALRGVLKESWLLGLLPLEEWSRIRAGIEQVEGSYKLAGRMLTPEEQVRLVEVASKRPGNKGVRDGAIIAVALATGLRRFELASKLLIGSVQGDYFVPESLGLNILGKRNKPRLIPLTWAAPYFTRWMALRLGAAPKQDEPVFCRLARRPSFNRKAPGKIQHQQGISPSGMGVIIDGIAEEAGVKDFSSHDLRRTYVSTLWDLNVDAKTIADLAGHDSIKTSQGYDRRNEKRLFDAAKRILSPFDVMKDNSGGK